MSYQELVKLLGKKEHHWFDYYKKNIPLNPNPLIANGEIQCYSIEDIPPESTSGILVIGVGINYGQNPRGVNSINHAWLTPHLLRKKNKLLPAIVNERDWVVDYNIGSAKPYDPEMRLALDEALKNYFGNEVEWVTNRHASHTDVACSLKQFKGGCYPYAMIATNFSPFLTQKCWSEHYPTSAATISSPLVHFDHLSDLSSCLKDIDQNDVLWVFHGMEHVWPLFAEWIKQNPIQNWLRTPNLSRRLLNRGNFKSFWKH